MTESIIVYVNYKKRLAQITKLVANNSAPRPDVTMLFNNKFNLDDDKCNFEHLLGYNISFIYIDSEDTSRRLDDSIIIFRYIDHDAFKIIKNIIFNQRYSNEKNDIYYLSEEGNLMDFRSLFKFFNEWNCFLSFNKK